MQIINILFVLVAGIAFSIAYFSPSNKNKVKPGYIILTGIACSILGIAIFLTTSRNLWGLLTLVDVTLRGQMYLLGLAFIFTGVIVFIINLINKLK